MKNLPVLRLLALLWLSLGLPLAARTQPKEGVSQPTDGGGQLPAAVSQPEDGGGPPSADAGRRPTLLPAPAQVTWEAAHVDARRLRQGLHLGTFQEAIPSSARALERLGPYAAALLRPYLADRDNAGGIRLRLHVGAGPVADESYRLRVYADSISLRAPAATGALRGLETLRQLLLGAGLPLSRRPLLPLCDIADAPRFAWRGLLIDPARHFLPVPVIKRNIDGMAAVKLNVLHWHLSDDQGWRVESQLFPRLQQVAGATGCYTQAEVREVVAYARERGIRVVPEFDLPGHSGALLAAYPRLASNDSIKAVPVRWGVLNIALDPTRESTYQLLDSLLTEMSGLFPDPYFHLGGDENDGRQWRHSPRIVQFMQEQCFLNARGFVDKHQLQTYFNRRVLATVQRLGKTMVGWDEILGPDLPAPIVIESWRGPKGVAAATAMGHPALRANGYYIDLYLPAATHYAADPLDGVPDSLHARVLGGEAEMWSEFADSVLYDSRVWPRAAAVAERLWSPAAVRDVPDLYRRLAFVSDELAGLGLRHRRAPAALLQALAAPYPAALPALQTLAAVCEPVKNYSRHFQGFKYTTETPLTRLVDAAPAESDVARRFGATVDSLLADLGSAARPLTDTAASRQALLLAGTAPRPELPPAARRHLAEVQRQLAEWQQATTQLPPLLVVSPSLTEYAPLAAQLGLVCEVLTQRLTQLSQGQPLLPAWQAAARLQLDAAQKPAGQAELAIIGAARRLAGL